MAELALDLDHHAIALLRRAPDGAGWERLGEARLAASDLDVRLRALRDLAEEAAPGGRAEVELVIPDSQVLHLDIDLEDDGVEGWKAMAPGARRAAVARALEGRTPHEARELAFDWHGAGPRLRVAVVTAQTLREAEAFARGYGFAPVALRAWPDAEGGFPDAPDFGPPRSAPETASRGPGARALGARDARTDRPSPSEQGAERLAVAMSRHARGLGERPPGAAAAAAARPGPAASRAEEAEALTVFGARGRPRETARRPRGRTLAVAGGLAALLALGSTAALTLWPGGGGGGDELATVAPIAPPEAMPAPSASRAPEPRPFGAEPVVVPVPPAGAPARTADAGGDGQTDPAARVEQDRAGAEAAGTDAPRGAALSEIDRARASYAATGIWRRPPEPVAAPEPQEAAPPPAPAAEAAEPATLTVAAALAPPAVAVADAPPGAMPPPPAPGAAFALGADGRVAAAPEGTVTPEGVTVYAAAPPRRPPSRPLETIAAPEPAVEEAPAPDAAQPGPAVAEARPRPRPEGEAVAEAATEAEAAPDGVSDALAEALTGEILSGSAGAASLFRAPDTLPEVTPQGTTIIDETTGGDFAVAASLRPYARPGDLAESAEAARVPSPAEQAAQAAAATIRTAAAPPPAPPPVAAPAPATATAAPAIPSRASVARRATVENALAMRQMTLMGVFGAEGARRALVRLPSGRFEKVKVGDRIEGGQVAAIDDGRLIYVRGGRNYALDLPRE